MNLAELLQDQAAQRPDARAIIDRDRVLTFSELDAAAARGARFLRDAGLGSGDAVLIFQPVSAELYVVLAAIFRLGLVATFVDPSAGREHLERCCELLTPKALIGSARACLWALLSPALRRIPLKFSLGFALPGTRSWRNSERMKPLQEVPPCDHNAPALVTFTSGSMGEPKAVMRSHGFLLAQHRALEECLRLVAGEVDLTTLPIFALGNLASGVTSLLADADLRRPAAIDPARIAAQIRRHRPDRVGASPALLERLGRHLAKTREPVPSLKKIYTGGGPVFPRTLDLLHEVAPAADIFAVYGSTEAEPIALLDRCDIDDEGRAAMARGSGLLVGVPHHRVALRILRDRWGQPLGPWGQEEFKGNCASSEMPGEIVVSGEHVLAGYLDGRGDAETKIRVDDTVWHRTGDAGYLDGAGRLWLLGRCSARITDEHGTLYPFGVECAASERPGVHRCALVQHRGRRVLAVEGAADCEALKTALAWAGLSEVRTFAHLPVDQRHNAKIDYPALRRLFER